MMNPKMNRTMWKAGTMAMVGLAVSLASVGTLVNPSPASAQIRLPHDDSGSWREQVLAGRRGYNSVRTTQDAAEKPLQGIDLGDEANQQHFRLLDIYGAIHWLVGEARLRSVVRQ